MSQGSPLCQAPSCGFDNQDGVFIEQWCRSESGLLQGVGITPWGETTALAPDHPQRPERGQGTRAPRGAILYLTPDRVKSGPRQVGQVKTVTAGTTFQYKPWDGRRG
jgi:hypothetical protein